MRIALTLTAALLLSACATQRVNSAVASQPPGYQMGYRAGCDSGLNAGGNPYYRFNKDAATYGSDGMYKQGWDDGFAVCKGQYDAIGGALRR